MIALLNLSALGFLFVVFHDKAKRTQQGNLLNKKVLAAAGEQKVETYVRVSAPPWKGRSSGHKSSFTNPNKKGKTKLSTYSESSIKAKGSTFDDKWKVIDRGAPFTPVTGRCNLCTKEKF